MSPALLNPQVILCQNISLDHGDTLIYVDVNSMWILLLVIENHFIAVKFEHNIM